jgi:hypothetical protein
MSLFSFLLFLRGVNFCNTLFYFLKNYVLLIHDLTANLFKYFIKIIFLRKILLKNKNVNGFGSHSIKLGDFITFYK